MRSLRRIAQAFAATPWEVFAVIAAVFALIIGGGLLLYPNVYSISKSYAVLSEWVPNAKVLGSIALMAVSLVILAIDRPLGLYGVLGVFLLHLLLAVTSFLSVGTSAGTFFYIALATLAYYGFFRSGGIRRGT